MKAQLLRDPTAETASVLRARRSPPPSFEGITIGLLDIGKTRSDEFLDRIERRLGERKLATRRYKKSTNARTAPIELLQKIADESQVVIIALSD